MYHELSPETPVRCVRDEIAEMLRSNSDLSLEDVRTINHGLGWVYELRHRPGAHLLVRGNRLDDPDLLRAWQLAQEHTPLPTAPFGA